MDIDLLAKMVKEVVMDHDVVTLPGVGSFVAELVPATFADRGYTILPPYRKLYFSPKQGEDTLLAALYARSNNISEADATRILTDFLLEMKEVLKVKKAIVFPGLGRLRATLENHIFFVADEDLDIYPSGFGLQPISLKTHEETREEVEEAVANLAGMLERQPEPEPVVTPEPVVAPEPEPAAEPEPVPEPIANVPEDGTLAQNIGENVSNVPEVGTLEEPAPLAEPEPEPVVAPVPEPTPAPEPAPATVPEEPEAEAPVQKHGSWRWLWMTLLILVIVALVAAIALVALGQLAPEWLDSILYSPEEYEFLHNQ